MANKALAKRQKLSFRVEPSQKAQRNPSTAATGLRAAAQPHRKATTRNRILDRLLRKRAGDDQA